MRIPYSVLLAGSAFIISFALTPLVMLGARRLSIVDRPGPRRIHTKPIPTAGGLAMAVAVLGVAWERASSPRRPATPSTCVPLSESRSPRAS